jgi:hypothetical protein
MLESGAPPPLQNTKPLWEQYYNMLSDADLETQWQSRESQEARNPVKDALSGIYYTSKVDMPEYKGNLSELTTCSIASLGYALGTKKVMDMLPDLKRFVGRREMLYETLRNVGTTNPFAYSVKAPIEQIEPSFQSKEGFLWVVNQKGDTSNLDPVKDIGVIELLKRYGIENQEAYIPHMFAGLKRNGDNPFWDVFDIVGKKNFPDDIFFGMTPGQVLDHAKSYGPAPNDHGFGYPSMLVKWF